jgi:L-methionine (R)-S-oxide reductase
MFSPTSYEWTDKRAGYDALVRDLSHLLEGERDPVANAAQTAALIWHALPDLNWAGFYFFDGAELVVGPFQGLPACTRIALDRGVCGAAASRRESIVVPDVEAFPGHIACDSRSRSELVVPIVGGDGALRGVLDMDSPNPARFDEADREGVERLVAVFVAATAWRGPTGAAD